MTKEHWDIVQSELENIKCECNDIKDGGNIKDCITNICYSMDAIYVACEEDYCDDSTDELPHGYEEIWPMFPDGNMLSVGDMNRLKEHIEAWKRGE